MEQQRDINVFNRMTYQVPEDSNSSHSESSYLSFPQSELEFLSEEIVMSNSNPTQDPDQARSLFEQFLSSMPRRNETKWPEWNGRNYSFRSFLFKLKVKIEEDRPILGSDRAVCLDMLGTLPKDKRSRVDGWFQHGGTNGAYQYLEFLDHFKAIFEDK